MCERAEKMQKCEEVKVHKIGTHDGQFHCDEALACWLLQKTKKFQNAEVVRSRDPKVHQEMDILVDVGAIYDPAKFRFDHHQREFTGTFSPNHATKLSSAGLIYKHFGVEILQGMLPTLTETEIMTLYNTVYDNFIEEIDGVDNGVSCYPLDIVPKYRVTTTLAHRIAGLNPRWNDPTQDSQKGFEKAMQVAGSEFAEKVDYYGNAWIPARSFVAAALDKRFEVDPGGSIVVLEGHVPWKEHLFELEKAAGAKILYVLYPGENDSWRVQCVPVRQDSFESRRPLPEPLRGLRDEALSAKCGIDGGIFVHASGFIGGMKSFDSALALARLGVAES